jgi:hypothetical protein
LLIRFCCLSVLSFLGIQEDKDADHDSGSEGGSGSESGSEEEEEGDEDGGSQASGSDKGKGLFGLALPKFGTCRVLALYDSPLYYAQQDVQSFAPYSSVHRGVEMLAVICGADDVFRLLFVQAARAAWPPPSPPPSPNRATPAASRAARSACSGTFLGAAR